MGLFIIIGIIMAIIVALIWWETGRTFEQARLEIHAYVAELIADPTNPAVQAEFWTRIGSKDVAQMPTSISEAAYQTVLDILEQHPESQSLRTFALKLGRWQKERQRHDRRLAMYDEQAIANDILIRTNGTKQLVDLHR